MLEQPGVSPDAGLKNRSDLLFTYRNIDETINFYGTDMAVDFLVNDQVTLAGTFGRVINTVFPDIQSGIGPLRINAPQNKATLAAQYRNNGQDQEARRVLLEKQRQRAHEEQGRQRRLGATREKQCRRHSRCRQHADGT